MIEDQLRRFISERFSVDGSQVTLTDNFPLIESNLIDSLGIFHLVSYMEREFQIEVRDEELVPDYFATIGQMARFIESKKH
jgi:acyl carrier protein